MLESALKKKIKHSLLAEQRAACCYCTSQIKADNMKVEHWLSQKDNPEKRLDWDNLFAACMGGEKSGQERYCDSSKGSQSITLDPRNQQHIDKITYTTGGKIGSSNTELEKELTQTLNLNASQLVRAREAAWKAFLKLNKIKKEKLGETRYTEPHIRNIENSIQTKPAKPHQAIILFFLKKKLAS